MLVGFVIFIPFTTQGISDSGSSDLPLPTALYAVNVAAVVLATGLLEALGRRRGLLDAPQPSSTVQYVAAAAVFVASIPVAYWVSADAAKLFWLSLIVINPVADRLMRLWHSRIGEKPAMRR
ncbi:hypothetical protein [Mycolicibacterium thermoresistibile]